MADSDPDMAAVLEAPKAVQGAAAVTGDPDMQAVLSAAPAPAPTKPSRTFGEKAVGVGEAIASTLSGMASTPLAAVNAGLDVARNAFESATSGQLHPEDIPAAFERYRQATTYAPRTAAGREYLSEFGKAVDESKLAAPIPELAMLPTSAAPLAAGPRLGEMLEEAARNELPAARASVPAPFSSASLSPKAAVPVGTAPSAAPLATRASAPLSAAAPMAAAAPQMQVTGAMQRAAQTLIDESGLSADQLSARLRNASAATPSSLPPTTGNLIGGKVASLEKALRADADVKDVLGDADIQRTQAQLANISGRFGGSEQDLKNLKDARSANSAAWTGENGYLSNPNLQVDAGPVADQINKLIKSPLGRDAAVNAGLKSTLSDIAEIAQNGQIDIGNLDAIRQNIRDRIAQNSTHGIVGSKTDVALNPIRDAITNQIESAVPGYRDYLAQYAADSKKINTMEAANSFRDWTGGRPLVNPDGTPSISYQQTTNQLKDILNREGGIDPELENAVNAMHQDMRRGTVVAMSQKQAGSDTLANISARGRLERATAAGVRLLPQGIVPQTVGAFASDVASKVASGAALQTKQSLARMMADPRFAADVIDSMSK